MGAERILNPRFKLIDNVASGEELMLSSTTLIYNLDEKMCVNRLSSAKGYISLRSGAQARVFCGICRGGTNQGDSRPLQAFLTEVVGEIRTVCATLLA